MRIHLLIILLIISPAIHLAQDDCSYDPHLLQLDRLVYDIGDIMSLEDQQVGHPVCYGSYPDAMFRFSDLNGELNGGDYKVIMVRMNESG